MRLLTPILFWGVSQGGYTVNYAPVSTANLGGPLNCGSNLITIMANELQITSETGVNFFRKLVELRMTSSVRRLQLTSSFSIITNLLGSLTGIFDVGLDGNAALLPSTGPIADAMSQIFPNFDAASGNLSALVNGPTSALWNGVKALRNELVEEGIPFNEKDFKGLEAYFGAQTPQNVPNRDTLGHFGEGYDEQKAEELQQKLLEISERVSLDGFNVLGQIEALIPPESPLRALSEANLGHFEAFSDHFESILIQKVVPEMGGEGQIGGEEGAEWDNTPILRSLEELKKGEEDLYRTALIDIFVDLEAQRLSLPHSDVVLGHSEMSQISQIVNYLVEKRDLVLSIGSQLGHSVSQVLSEMGDVSINETLGNENSVLRRRILDVLEDSKSELMDAAEDMDRVLKRRLNPLGMGATGSLINLPKEIARAVLFANGLAFNSVLYAVYTNSIVHVHKFTDGRIFTTSISPKDNLLDIHMPLFKDSFAPTQTCSVFTGMRWITTCKTLEIPRVSCPVRQIWMSTVIDSNNTGWDLMNEYYTFKYGSTECAARTMADDDESSVPIKNAIPWMHKLLLRGSAMFSEWAVLDSECYPNASHMEFYPGFTAIGETRVVNEAIYDKATDLFNVTTIPEIQDVIRDLINYILTTSNNLSSAGMDSAAIKKQNSRMAYWYQSMETFDMLDWISHEKSESSIDTINGLIVGHLTDLGSVKYDPSTNELIFSDDAAADQLPICRESDQASTTTASPGSRNLGHRKSNPLLSTVGRRVGRRLAENGVDLAAIGLNPIEDDLSLDANDLFDVDYDDQGLNDEDDQDRIPTVCATVPNRRLSVDVSTAWNQVANQFNVWGAQLVTDLARLLGNPDLGMTPQQYLDEFETIIKSIWIGGAEVPSVVTSWGETVRTNFVKRRSPSAPANKSNLLSVLGMNLDGEDWMETLKPLGWAPQCSFVLNIRSAKYPQDIRTMFSVQLENISKNFSKFSRVFPDMDVEGDVHSGYLAYGRVITEMVLSSLIDREKDNTPCSEYNIAVTGIEMGGALANVVGYILSQSSVSQSRLTNGPFDQLPSNVEPVWDNVLVPLNVEVVAFDAPRVFGRSLTKLFNKINVESKMWNRVVDKSQGLEPRSLNKRLLHDDDIASDDFQLVNTNDTFEDSSVEDDFTTAELFSLTENDLRRLQNEPGLGTLTFYNYQTNPGGWVSYPRWAPKCLATTNLRDIRLNMELTDYDSYGPNPGIIPLEGRLGTRRSMGTITITGLGPDFSHFTTPILSEPNIKLTSLYKEWWQCRG